MQSIPSKTVFLPDAISPRTLSACRSLGKKGISVTCADESPFNLAFFSRYCQERTIYPSPLRDPQHFAEYLLDYLADHPQDCMIPVKEESLDVIMLYREEFEQLTRLPFPPTSIFQVCRDKNKTMALAKRLGIPHPKTVMPNCLDQVNAFHLHKRRHGFKAVSALFLFLEVRVIPSIFEAMSASS